MDENGDIAQFYENKFFDYQNEFRKFFIEFRF